MLNVIVGDTDGAGLALWQLRDGFLGFSILVVFQGSVWVIPRAIPVQVSTMEISSSISTSLLFPAWRGKRLLICLFDLNAQGQWIK